eukprot:2569696-Karenia_brevis.AAC.1
MLGAFQLEPKLNLTQTLCRNFPIANLSKHPPGIVGHGCYKFLAGRNCDQRCGFINRQSQTR